MHLGLCIYHTHTHNSDKFACSMNCACMNGRMCAFVCVCFQPFALVCILISPTWLLLVLLALPLALSSALIVIHDVLPRLQLLLLIYSNALHAFVCAFVWACICMCVCVYSQLVPLTFCILQWISAFIWLKLSLFCHSWQMSYMCVRLCWLVYLSHMRLLVCLVCFCMYAAYVCCVYAVVVSSTTNNYFPSLNEMYFAV